MKIWCLKLSKVWIYKKTLGIFNKYLSPLVKFIHGSKKMCIAAKILGNLHFLFFGFPSKFLYKKVVLHVHWTISKKWCIFDIFATILWPRSGRIFWKFKYNFPGIKNFKKINNFLVNILLPSKLRSKMNTTLKRLAGTYNCM